MARSWGKTTIGEQATLQRGIDITRKQQRHGSIPVVSSGGISSFHDTAQVTGPGVVLGRKGTLGSVYYISDDFWPHDTTLWVKDFHGNNQRFVYYFFLCRAKQLLSMDVGAANPTLNRNHVHPIEVEWPPLPEQKAIAHILGTLDGKIDLNRRMNETLEAMARAIFKSWFIDFDDCTEFEDSEIGRIPKGWRVGTLNDGFNVTMGQSPPGSTYNESGEGLPFFQGRRDFGFRFPNNRVYCIAPKRLANPLDTLLSVRAPVGDVNMAAEKCCIGRGVAAIRHKSGSVAYTHCSVKALKTHFDNFDKEGTVFGSISKKDFLGLPQILPPEQNITKFEDIAGPLDEKVRLNEQENKTLATLRDTLLPKLISGEVRVPDAEKIVGEAT